MGFKNPWSLIYDLTLITLLNLSALIFLIYKMKTIKILPLLQSFWEDYISFYMSQPWPWDAYSSHLSIGYYEYYFT